MSVIEASANSHIGARRAQRRQATFDEMITVARQALADERPLSLRGVAADMGLTAPALYRYVDSHAALQVVLTDAIYDDVLVELDAAALKWPADRPGRRLIASVMAFRRWALTAPAEFRLVFGQPHAAWIERGGSGEVPRAMQFFLHYMRFLAELYRSGQLAAPSEADLPESVTQLVGEHVADWLRDESDAEIPLSLWWAGLRDWAVICGVIRMEVDGLVPRPVVEDGVLFRHTLHCLGQNAGGRLQEVVAGVDGVYAQS